MNHRNDTELLRASWKEVLIVLGVAVFAALAIWGVMR